MLVGAGLINNECVEALEERLDMENLLKSAEEPYFIPEETPLNMQILNFQKMKLVRSLLIDAFFPVITFVSLVFMPPVGIVVVIAAILLAMLSHKFVNAYEPKPEGPAALSEAEAKHMATLSPEDAKEYEAKTLMSFDEHSYAKFKQNPTLEHFEPINSNGFFAKKESELQSLLQDGDDLVPTLSGN